LQAADSRVLAAQAETASVRNSYRPQINAFGMGDVMKMPGEQTSGGMTFGLVASISIWSGGEKSARLQTSQAKRRRQEAENERLMLQIGQEVQAAVLNLRAAEQNVQTSQVALKSAQEDYRIARLRYEAGKSILTEVLDALASRVRAESNVVQALYQYNAARDQLQRAVGSL
jgi:outer membrane protein TolC